MGDYWTNETSHASRFLAWIQEMRKSQVMCDVNVHVKRADPSNPGLQTFPAHRVVLAFGSGYFRDLLQTEEKNLEDKSRNMRPWYTEHLRHRDGINKIHFDVSANVKAEVFEHCLHFMYTGEINVTMETIDDLLEASEKLKIPALSRYCLDFLKRSISMKTCVRIIDISQKYRNISVLSRFCFDFLRTKVSAETCLEIVDIARKYDKKDVVDYVEDFLVKNLMEVSQTSSFLQVKKPDFVRYIAASTVNGKEIWMILNAWMSRKEYFTRKSILAELIPGQNSAILKKYMLENFDELAKQNGFFDLGSDDISYLLSSPELKCSSENAKLEALLKWVRHDERRKLDYPKLFITIKLERLSFNLIIDLIKSEPLVTEHKNERNMLLDTLVVLRRSGPPIREPRSSSGMSTHSGSFVSRSNSFFSTASFIPDSDDGN